MSSIVTDQGILHYETIGRGRPVILLHGWINSWYVWREPMLALASTGNYRVYALDFWGFGDSAKRSDHQFGVVSFAAMVTEFMDVLGIQSAPIAGHSMGGTVSLELALSEPTRIEKVMVVGSPILGRTLNVFLQLAGYSWIADLVWRLPGVLPLIMWSLLARDAPRVRSMISHDVQRTTVESFFRSIGDLRDTDMRLRLGNLRQPVLGMFGSRDNIVSPRNADILSNCLESAEIRMMERSRHFPMVDQPEQFQQALIEFLSGPKSRPVPSHDIVPEPFSLDHT